MVEHLATLVMSRVKFENGWLEDAILQNDHVRRPCRKWCGAWSVNEDVSLFIKDLRHQRLRTLRRSTGNKDSRHAPLNISVIAQFAGFHHARVFCGTLYPFKRSNSASFSRCFSLATPPKHLRTEASNCRFRRPSALHTYDVPTWPRHIIGIWRPNWGSSGWS